MDKLPELLESSLNDNDFKLLAEALYAYKYNLYHETKGVGYSYATKPIFAARDKTCADIKVIISKLISPDRIAKFKKENVFDESFTDPGFVFTTPHFLTTPNTFLVEIQKVDLTLPHQVKRKKALLESNLSGLA